MDQATSVPIRLVSLNIRVDTPRLFPGEKPWSVRCPKLCAQLDFITRGIDNVFLCLQEATQRQIDEINANLSTNWTYIGRGRDDGKKGGEFCPIFYRHNYWTCKWSETLWLSETPKQPSRSWDSSLNRIVTVGKFEHKQSGTHAIFMNTHLDHHGPIARLKSAQFLVDLANKGCADDYVRNIKLVPVFLAGDFNSTPDSDVYKTLTAPDSGLYDLSHRLGAERRYGHRDITYTSFGQEQCRRIDYLFTTREPKNVIVMGFGVLPNVFDDKVYLTDHRPVVADIEILPLLDKPVQ
ncbi:Endonuclease/exonuclease/phosphatase [Echria macrotheca]|uniref:Endonuclease/exonuclease/phosphatase n=1 Tax=Echria macrotheca TaxID=438768 RepID=A0AAJ0FGG5_9PEZI|nr:Endonuclease/exonuclease/phosphatase [Echria macrotheca]